MLCLAFALFFGSTLAAPSSLSRVETAMQPQQVHNLNQTSLTSPVDLVVMGRNLMRLVISVKFESGIEHSVMVDSGSAMLAICPDAQDPALTQPVPQGGYCADFPLGEASHGYVGNVVNPKASFGGVMPYVQMPAMQMTSQYGPPVNYCARPDPAISTNGAPVINGILGFTHQSVPIKNVYFPREWQMPPNTDCSQWNTKENVPDALVSFLDSNAVSDPIYALTWTGTFGRFTGGLLFDRHARHHLTTAPTSGWYKTIHAANLLPRDRVALTSSPFATWDSTKWSPGENQYPGVLLFGPIEYIAVVAKTGFHFGREVFAGGADRYYLPKTPRGEGWEAYGYGFDTGSPWLQFPEPVCQVLNNVSLHQWLDATEIQIKYGNGTGPGSTLHLPLRQWMGNASTPNSPIPGIYAPTNATYCPGAANKYQHGVNIFGIQLMRWYDVAVDYTDNRMHLLEKANPALQESF